MGLSRLTKKIPTFKINPILSTDMKIPFQKIININNDNDRELNDKENEWINLVNSEEQLAIDVYQTSNNIVIKSTIAGVKSEDIKISLSNDILTIKGARKKQDNKNIEHYLYKECFWGAFSRTIILPMEVKINKINATLEDGVLTITLPINKIETEKIIKIKER